MNANRGAAEVGGEEGYIDPKGWIGVDGEPSGTRGDSAGGSMSTVRYIRCPNPFAICPFHHTDSPVVADWFFYVSADHNAVAMCNSHALAQLSMCWALGDTVLISGQQYDPPPPFVKRSS